MQARYPHLDGRTGLCYSECGKYLLTCGDNGMVRRFIVGSPQTQPEFTEIIHNGLDIKVIPQQSGKAAQFVVCCDDGEAEVFGVESLQKSSMLFRTALPLREVNVSGDGKWCVLTGDDKCVIVNVEDITLTNEVCSFPAKHANFHPTNSDILCVSTLDGVVRVLRRQYSDSEPKTVAELEMIVPAVKSADDPRSTAGKWCPQGEALALPSKTFDISVVSAKDWLVSFRLSGHTNAITAFEWSPNGRYIASCGKDDRLLVFDMSTGGAVADHPLVDGCELRWHPHSNELSATTYKGQLYVFNDIVPSELVAPHGGDLYNPVEARGMKAQPLFLEDPTNSSYGADSKRSSEIPHQEGQGTDGLFLSSDDDFVVEDEDHPSSKSIASDLKPLGIGGHSRGRSSRGGDSIPSKRMRLSAIASSQHAFQSGSTPWLDQRRYLSMSPTGYVWAVRQDSSHQTVTINFFDQSTHKEIYFQDTDLFDLASLNSQAVLLANSRSGQLSVRFHSMLADNWNTTIDTEVDGQIQCVALSSQVIAVFTKNGFMRTYTIYGSPLFVSRTPPNVVCCSAGGDNELVYICYNQLSESFTYTFENLAAPDVIYQKGDSLDVSPHSQIKALFFSEEGEPCVMDSSGVLSILLNGRKMGRARWVPVLGNPETSEDKVQRKYWPISVSEDKLLCVVLRGQLQYPPIPLPITDEVQLKVPGNNSTEADYLVARALLKQSQARIEFLTELGAEVQEEAKEAVADQSIELDKMILRQFQQACESHRINRALLLAEIIQGEQSLEAAVQVASAYGLSTLADRISEGIQ